MGCEKSLSTYTERSSQIQVFSEPHSTGQNSFMFDVCSAHAVGFSLKVTELLCRFSHGAVQP